MTQGPDRPLCLLSMPQASDNLILEELCCLQFDIHSPANTVREALNFSAELRLEGVNAKQRTAFVDEARCILLHTLQVYHASHVLFRQQS